MRAGVSFDRVAPETGDEADDDASAADLIRHMTEVVRDDERRLDDLEDEIERARHAAEPVIGKPERHSIDDATDPGVGTPG